MKVTFNDIVAQLAHIGWGGWMPFLMARLDWELPQAWRYKLPCFIVPIVIAAAKEAVESLGIAPWESKQPWLSSGIDFAFFLVGIGATFVLFGPIF